jgi:CheY-like chemotaxis protein
MRGVDDPHGQRPLRVLVADDEQPVRLLVRVTLEVEGMDVTEAADGEAAVLLALGSVPDVAVLDVMMPRLDGFEVAARLRESAQTQRIGLVFLTASTATDAAQRAAELDALFVQKPFDPARLPPVVRRAAGTDG